MLFSVIVAAVTCVFMIIGVLFYPKITIKNVSIDSYWFFPLLGALLLISCGNISLNELGSQLVANTSVNPIKILVLFISMTSLSIYLDCLGFFSYVADKAVYHAGNSQVKLFFVFYMAVSVLTAFTSNDIIILTFTPFICCFAVNEKISPIPYLVAEFVAANTWSMALIIGNPTNIYLSSSYGIGFVDYLKAMFIPTVLAGTVSFAVLYLMFRKKLKEPLIPNTSCAVLKDKLLLAVGLIHLGVCTVMLAVSSYISLDMWLISLICALSLAVCTLAVSAFRKSRPTVLGECVKRLPWQLIPFVLSMFVIVLSLSNNGISEEISNLAGTSFIGFKYGIFSFLSANLINNIPMSVLFCSVLSPLHGSALDMAVFSSIIGSNIGAFLTPIGALAGIMWTGIMKEHGLKFSCRDFIRYGSPAAVPALLAAVAGLYISL